MKIKLKKIIAREFLFLLSGVIITLCFLSIFSNCEKLLNEKKTNLKVFKESDTIAYRLKLYYKTKELSESNTENSKKYIEEISEFSKFPDVNEFIKNVKKEKVYKNIWNSASKYYDIDRTKDENFENKIISDKNNSEILLTKIERFEKEITEKEKSFFCINSNLKIIIVIAFLILFFLRYIFYATIWSIRQLKNKNFE